MYAQNNHRDDTQFGEAGIIHEIFKRLKVKKGVCIEFGAGDGKEISNTYSLWNDQGWHGLLIEPDTDKYDQLVQLIDRLNKTETVTTLPLYVHNTQQEIQGKIIARPLDDIIDEYIPVEAEKGVDLVSIDIDGNDYHVWDSLKKYIPSCIIIEYNSEFPPHMNFINPIGECMGLGSSIRSLNSLGIQKGYKCVAATKGNIFFVKDELINKLGNVCTDINELHDPSWCTYIISEMNTRRAWMSKKNPSHYYIYGDPKIRDNIRDKDLYPIHMHYANWDTPSGKFRIQNNELYAFENKKNDPYAYPNHCIEPQLASSINLEDLYHYMTNNVSKETIGVSIE